MGGFRIEIRRTAIRLLMLYVAVGIAVAIAGGHHGLSLLDPHGIPATALVFADLALVALLVHESGHGIAGLLVGRKVVGLVVKMGAGVLIEEAEPGTLGSSRVGHVIVAVAGPLASLLLGTLYVSLAHGVGSPALWAGLAALGDGIVNLLPLTRTTDGGRLLAALEA